MAYNLGNIQMAKGAGEKQNDGGNSNLELVQNQLVNRYKQLFGDKIDLSDLAGKTVDIREQSFRSRSFAALALMNKLGLKADDAAKCITDGGNDDGIDAISHDENSKRLYFVQSKWRQNTNKGMAISEFTRFRDGVKKIISLQWDEDNKNLHRFKGIVELALGDINTSVELIFADNSSQAIAASIRRNIDKFLKDQNKYNQEFISFSEFTLPLAVAAARSSIRQSDIDVVAMLASFGVKEQPYYSVYGSISAVDIVNWYAQHENKLFTENIRFTIDKSGVNEAIANTAANNPDVFWYYNNGITAICDKVTKQPMGGAETEYGVFDIKKISIINGAQTIGSLAKARTDGANIDSVRVHIRFIALAGTPDGFATSVTSANNTQNEISPIDFLAIDPNQERIRVEAGQAGIIYTYRRGEKEPTAEKGFTVRFAAIAAACASGELRLAVAAKRYVGGLWENSKREPYISLFNEQTSAKRLWTIVKVMRVVDSTLQDIGPSLPGRGNLIVTHGNRFLMFLVCKKLGISGPTSLDINQDVLLNVSAEIQRLIPKFLEEFNDLNGEGYPGNFFKNFDKQSELLKRM